MSVAILYRWRIKAGRERDFAQAWSEGTRLIHLHCGSYGARLHRAERGEFWSYARWPSEAARRSCFAHPEVASAACFATMRDCVEHRFDEVVMDLLDDRLAEPKQTHPSVSLTTQRLILRPLTVEDAPALHGALSDPETMRYWSRGPHASLDDTRTTVRRNVGNGDHQSFAITERDGSDEAVGWVVLIDRKPGVGEIGYLLRPDARGRGLAREAVSAVVDHGITIRGFRRIYADTDPENEASVRLLRALGFALEGTLVGQWQTHLGVRDSAIYARVVGLRG